MGNPFVHVELTTSDVTGSKAFYGKLFDWTLEDMVLGPINYTMVEVGEGTGGGMMALPHPGCPTTWMPYVLVEDVAASTAKAMSLGGKIVKELTEVPGKGSFSIISDPQGAVIGLWKPLMRPGGP